MFTFLNEMETVEENWRNSNYDISGQQLNINAYTEIGLGLSRQINSRLTVGARVKALLGIGNMGKHSLYGSCLSYQSALPLHRT